MLALVATRVPAVSPQVDPPRRVLVTGASRGIGAAIALELAARGCVVTACYREKHRRAAVVADAITRFGRECHLIEGDLSAEEGGDGLIRGALEHAPYDAIVLNASGGLEPGKALPYALAINCFAQIALVSALVPTCGENPTVVYVTSHGAHFYPRNPVLPLYETVAYSKQCGEQSLRRMASLMAGRGVRLKIVSGDIIEGTTTAMLIDRAVPGFVSRRRKQVGYLPGIDEFSAMVADAAIEEADGVGISTRYCGSTVPYLITGEAGATIA